MSTSPALVSIGEPLIEFNRPRKATAAPGCRASAAIRRTSPSPPPARAPRPAISPASARTGWATPSSNSGSPKASMPRASSRHPTAPTGVSFVTHGPAGHKFDYLRKNSAASLMTPETLAGGLHRGRPLLPSVGHRPGDQRQRPRDLRRRHRGRPRRRREGLLRHQPAPAAVGPRDGAGDDRRHHRALRCRCCRASTIPSSSPGSRGARRDRRSLPRARRAPGRAEDGGRGLPDRHCPASASACRRIASRRSTRPAPATRSTARSSPGCWPATIRGGGALCQCRGRAVDAGYGAVTPIPRAAEVAG